MKLKDGFLLRQVAGKYVVIPTDDDLDLSLMITLNETGAFLWEHLQSECDEAALVQALLKEYDVDADPAAACVTAFVRKLHENEFLV